MLDTLMYFTWLERHTCAVNRGAAMPPKERPAPDRRNDVEHGYGTVQHTVGQATNATILHTTKT